MESGYKETNGQRLYYEIHGEGAPLVLIMGQGSDVTAWGFQIPALAAHFRVIAFDNRDAGRSSMARGDYTIADMAEDTAGLMEALGVKRTSVLGISMGGTIAQELVLRHPDKVEKLVLACTVGQMARFRIYPLDPTLFILEHDASRNILFKQMMLQCMTHKFLQDAAAVDGMLELFKNPPFPQPPEAFLRQANAIRSFDALDRLHRVQVPTLVLVGDQDILTPPWSARELASTIPGAALKIIEGGGHGFSFEIPDEFNRAVLEFLMKSG